MIIILGNCSLIIPQHAGATESRIFNPVIYTEALINTINDNES
jgi:hypothetical protein